MLKRVLEKAKKGDDVKVNINFQVLSSLKDEFEKICKENSVSVTGMLNSLMEVIVDESKEKDKMIQAIEFDIQQLKLTQNTLKKTYDKYGIEELSMEDGTIRYIKKELDEINKQIESLESDIQHIIYEL